MVLYPILLSQSWSTTVPNFILVSRIAQSDQNLALSRLAILLYDVSHTMYVYTVCISPGELYITYYSTHFIKYKNSWDCRDECRTFRPGTFPPRTFRPWKMSKVDVSAKAINSFCFFLSLLFFFLFYLFFLSIFPFFLFLFFSFMLLLL